MPEKSNFEPKSNRKSIRRKKLNRKRTQNIKEKFKFKRPRLLSRDCKISKVSNFELVSELINFENFPFRLRIGFLINYFRNSNFELDSELINFEIFRLRIVPILPLIHCLRRNNPRIKKKIPKLRPPVENTTFAIPRSSCGGESYTSLISLRLQLY